MARKFTDPDNAKYAFDGYGLDHAFIATTGKPLIGLESGKLVSNLYDANIEKCMDMLRTFDDTQEQLRYPREIENNWEPAIMNGLTAIRSSLRMAHGDMKKPGESSRRKTSGKMMR